MKYYMGSDKVDQFTKLYLFPGVAHRGGGNGPNTFDIVTSVMAWAETGTKPGKIAAPIVDANGQATRTRPVFPYPAVARYTGSLHGLGQHGRRSQLRGLSAAVGPARRSALDR